MIIPFPRTHPVITSRKTTEKRKGGAISGIPRTPSLGQQSQEKKNNSEIPKEHGKKAKLKHYKALKEASTFLAQPLKMCHHLQSLWFWQEDNLQR